MSCPRCLLRRAANNPTIFISSRALTTSSSRSQATPITASTATTTVSRPHDRPAALTTPSTAQPFSTPLTPSPRKAASAASVTKASSKVPISSVPAGTVLKGLNFIKGKQDPVALEDSEYPDWLWGVLRQGEGEDGVGRGKAGEGEGDLFAKSKKQRQRAAKALRRQQLLHPESLVPKIPIYEQSVDLPGGADDTAAAQHARETLTKAMRDKRRKAIKEDNFLRAMR